MPRIIWLLPLLGASCLAPQARERIARLEERLDKQTTPGRSPAAGPPQAAPAAPLTSDARAEGGDFAQGVDLKSLLAEVLRRNPELGEAAERTRSALEEVRVAGALDDPVFKVETEAVPLRRPVSFDRAEDTMFGLSQSFPFPGKLRARSESALENAEALHELERSTQSDLVARTKRAYFEYFMFTQELRIHEEHVQLLEEFERVSEAKFRNGTVQQKDVLRAQLELVRLHNDVVFLEQRLGTAQAAINTLLNNNVHAPLGPPREVVPTEGRVDLEALEDKAIMARPELQAFRHRALASRAAETAAKKDSLFPDFMVGADYWQIPRGDDAWGGFVSINLPWLTGKRAAEARRMRHAARADELAAERTLRLVYFEVRDAYLRVEAAKTSILMIRGELLPKALQSVEVIRSSYENDRSSFLELLDAERSLRDVQLTYYRALAEHESALADLERAAGTNLDDQP